MQLKGVLVTLVGTVSTLVAFLALNSYYFEPNLCSMSYSRPTYSRLDFPSPNSKVGSKYEVFLYREGGVSPKFETTEDVNNLGGIPVLFIPGNAGSYSQGRSLASLAANSPEFDWFLVHFDEDLSALHGKTLLDEARYINDAIAYILNLYQQKTEDQVQPSSVIIVAHSMGGIVARSLPTLDNYVKDSINTIITLSTPHAYPPITFDRDVTQLYDLIGRWWRFRPDNAEIALVSLSGGHNDLLVLPDMNIVDSFGGISSFSYEVPGVGLGIDHLAIVWCAELRNAVVETIGDIADISKPGRTLPYDERMAKMANRLKYIDNEEKKSMVVEAESSMLWGKPHKFEIEGRTDILLPAKSSLVSYKVVNSVPMGISHRTEKEYRNYGTVGQTTLMWYSSGPYVPFANTTERLTLMIEPEPSSNVLKASVEVSVDWLATLANIIIHYRTLAACWPYAIVLITFMVLIDSQNVEGFGMALCDHVLSNWFIVIAVILSITHVASTLPIVRSALRLVQFPNESENILGLKYRGFDVHDLLLGVNDAELVWIVPLLLSIAACAALFVFLASSAIVSMNVKLHSLFRCRNTEKNRPSLFANISRNPYKLLVSVLGLTIILYLIPYQVTIVLLAIVQLLQVRDRTSISFAVSQLLLWTAVVDAPILAVWARNFTIEWIWAFASLRNVASCLPLAFYVLFVTPNSGSSMVRQPFVRKLTLVVMLYVVAYAFLYGGLHAFMLHHLTNYLSIWLIVANLRA